MSTCRAAARPLAKCLQHGRATAAGAASSRKAFATTPLRPQDATPTTPTTSSSGPPPPPPPETGNPLDLDPNTAVDAWAEAQLAKLGTPPLGSRRRRAALRTSPGLPFEQLPYQCFQEARALLAQAREEKVAALAAEAAKIRRLEEATGLTGSEEVHRQRRLAGLRRQVEKLKILADIDDPLVKKRFEDGLGALPLLGAPRLKGRAGLTVEQAT